MRERIKHAAVIAENGMIFLGKSHSDCFRQMLGVGVEPLRFANAQGFFTNKGRFVGRQIAAGIAFNAKQIKNRASVLFSEDLWNKKHYGLYKYDSVQGYYK